MILPKGLEQEFWQELKAYEEERRMRYISSVERMGFEQGIEQGERSLVLRLRSRKVGALPESFTAQINTLPPTELEALGEALLNFSSLSDLDAWLTGQKQ